MAEIADFLNRFIHGDCLEVMRTMPTASIDLVVTSPPYNLSNSTGGRFTPKSKGGMWNPELRNGYENHRDNMPHEAYVAWQRECLTEMLRLIKPNGAIFYNHKRRVQGGLLQDRQDIVGGFPVRQIIIWHRKGGINFNERYFLPAYELIYLICKPDFKLQPKANHWSDVWVIPHEQNNPHPAPFPLEIPYRCIASSDAQIILDPFMGSGTSALAATLLERQFIGIDSAPTYLAFARERLAVFKRQLAKQKMAEDESAI